MPGSRLLIGCLTSIALFSLICVCTAENKVPANQSSGLLQKIAALETRIAALEKRLEQQPSAVPVASSVYQASGIAPSAVPSLPRGSVTREFNGSPYYIVPLSKQVVR